MRTLKRGTHVLAPSVLLLAACAQAEPPATTISTLAPTPARSTPTPMGFVLPMRWRILLESRSVPVSRRGQAHHTERTRDETLVRRDVQKELLITCHRVVSCSNRSAYDAIYGFCAEESRQNNMLGGGFSQEVSPYE